jgi:hypothetical protein
MRLAEKLDWNGLDSRSCSSLYIDRIFVEIQVDQNFSVHLTITIHTQLMI